MKEDYDSLLAKYLELQLRVTQFSVVEQQLIDTRDKLDHELVQHKRFLEFSSQAIQAKDWADFNSLVSEFLIDIFEVECACFAWSSDGAERGMEMCVEGGSFTPVKQKYLMDFLRNYELRTPPGKAIILERPQLLKLDPVKLFDSGLIGWQRDEGEGFTLYLLGLNSIENAPLYSKQNERKKTMFAIFMQHVFGLYQNRAKSMRINNQLNIISKSQIELNKLSLIATKTKNGVIITDAEGRVEWVNDAFTKATGYSLEEVKGVKPGSVLQRPGVDSDVSHQLGEAIRQKREIEVNIQNFTKQGVKYYNNLQITPVFDDGGEVINFIALQRDITHEIEFKAQLMRMNSKFELITKRSNIGIWELDIQSGTVEWNDELYQQYGVDAKQEGPRLRELWRQLVHPEDSAGVIHKINELMFEGRDNVELSYRINRLRDGEERSLQCITIAERDENGTLLRLVGSSIDVTDAKQAAQKLKESEEKYRGIIDHMNLGLAEWGNDGRMIYYNRQFELQCGFDASSIQVLNGSMLETLTDLHRRRIVVEFEVLSNVIAEVTLQHPDGRKLHLLLSAAAVNPSSSGASGWITISHDITATKVMQNELRDALREKEKSIVRINDMKVFYENVLNHAPAEMAVFDANWKLLFANERLMQASELWPKLLGKRPEQLAQELSSTEEELEKLMSFAKMALEQRELVQYEESVIDGDDYETVMLKSVLPYYNAEQKLESIFLSGINISELKKVEKMLLRKNEELKKTNAELDNFVYSVSHDLRSPLLGIKGLFSLIFRSSSLDETTRKQLQMADASINRLDATIQEILHYSRNARLGLVVDEFNLDDVVEEIFSDLKHGGPVTMVMSKRCEGNSVVRTDKARVSILLKNLIGNSVKYCRKQAEHQIVDVDMRIHADRIFIEVHDNGEGISPSSLSKVFDMFYRATKSSVGTGLGLYIAKEIVNRLGGEISISSTLGEGTVVKVELPNQPE